MSRISASSDTPSLNYRSDVHAIRLALLSDPIPLLPQIQDQTDPEPPRSSARPSDTELQIEGDNEGQSSKAKFRMT